MPNKSTEQGQPIPDPRLDRRAHPRLPVTLIARVQHSAQSHRTEILDLSEGGLLLASIEGCRLVPGDDLRIEAASIGTVEVRVVAVSHAGIHAKIDARSQHYDESFRRLSEMTAAWRPE